MKGSNPASSQGSGRRHKNKDPACPKTARGRPISILNYCRDEVVFPTSTTTNDGETKRKRKGTKIDTPAMKASQRARSSSPNNPLAQARALLTSGPGDIIYPLITSQMPNSNSTLHFPSQMACNGNLSEQTAETWWEIAPGRTQGATPLFQRCLRVLGWDEGYTRRVLIAYRDFLEAKRFTRDYDDSKKLLPPLPVARMWQQHVLDMKHYEDDCNLLVGRLVCYIPDNETTMGQEEREARINTTKTLMSIRYHGAEDLDDEIWNFDDSVNGIEVNESASCSRKRSRSCSRVEETQVVRANPCDDENPQEVLSDPDSITIKVKDQFEENFQLKMKKSERIKKLFDYISNEIGLPAIYLRFRLNDLRFSDTETPNTLRMNEEDQIILWYDGGLNFVDRSPRQSNETVIWVSMSSNPTAKLPMYTRIKTSTKMKMISEYMSKVRGFNIDLYFRQNQIQAGDTAESLGWTREDRIIYKLL